MEAGETERTFQEAAEDITDPPEREVVLKMAGSQKLMVLGQRMQKEKLKVMEYLERKRQQEKELMK